MRLLSVVLFAASLGVGWVLPVHAQQTAAASWYFGRVTPGEQLSPGLELTGSGVPLYPAANTTVWGTHLDARHPYSVDFPGWLETAGDGTVDRTASMLSTDPDFASHPRGGGEAPGEVTLDPEQAAYSVSVWVLPERAALYPLGDRQPGAISPNIVQKGRADEVGGFWKVSLGLNRSSGGELRWFPFCTFQGGGYSVNPGLKHKPAEGKLRRYLVAGEAVKIECSKQGATGTLTVTSAVSGTPVFTASETAVDASGAPVNFAIANDAALSVGHKPRTTDPSDIYAGILDNLVIRKD